jgi:phosphohistidine phosphatase
VVCAKFLYLYKNRRLKQLFIIRHAKSNQDFWGNDFERPLNERGKVDASEMARRLLDLKIHIDALISSPATRAKKTAGLFAEALRIPISEIIFFSALYHAPAEMFYEVISGLSDDFESIAIFSHNPGITYFVNSLATQIKIDNMPTCGIFAVAVNIKHWREFSKAKKDFLFFNYPKNKFSKDLR